jgi:hypothetical protein
MRPPTPRAWLSYAFAVALGGTLVSVFVVAASSTSTSHQAIAAPPLSEIVTAYDAEADDDSYVLFAPFEVKEPPGPDQGRAYLIRKDGSVAHTWELPSVPGGAIALLPNGDLMLMGKTAAFRSREMLAPGGGESGVLYRLDWDGNVVWSFEDDYIHHDFEVLPDGTIAILRWKRLDPDLAERIPGGIADTDFDGSTWGDEVIEVSPEGVVRVVWDVADFLAPEDYPLPEFIDRTEWTHANALRYLPSNPVTGSEAYLMSFRQTSTVLMVDKASGEVIWSYGGAGVLHQQHDPTLTSDGTVLIFDNRAVPYGTALPSSRVVEIDPTSDEVVWQYQGEGVLGWRFFSSVISGAQRLSNGNTLITEGWPGRLMEVAPDGTIVWEYFHPFGGEDSTSRDPWTNVFRARAYPASLVEPLLER